MESAERYAGLDALRLIAAALVLFAHGAPLLYPLHPAFDHYLAAGWLGTELFFALSGFLVVRLLLAALPGDAGAAAAFGRRRLARVLPLYWLFVAVNAALWWWLHGRLPDALWTYPLLLQSAWQLHPAFFPEAWNLPVLLLFSLLAPWLALVASRRPDPRRALRNALVGVALVGLALRFGAAAWLDPAWDAGVRKWLPLRLDACAWGGVLACWLARMLSRRLRLQVGLIGFTLLLIAAWLCLALERDASLFARSGLFTLAGLGAAMLLPTLAIGRSPAALAFLARATWPLYLVNMPLLLVVQLAGVGGGIGGFALWLAACAVVAAGIQASRARPGRNV